jgi:hypothetical protein
MGGGDQHFLRRAAAVRAGAAELAFFHHGDRKPGRSDDLGGAQPGIAGAQDQRIVLPRQLF